MAAAYRSNYYRNDYYVDGDHPDTYSNSKFPSAYYNDQPRYDEYDYDYPTLLKRAQLRTTKGYQQEQQWYREYPPYNDTSATKVTKGYQQEQQRYSEYPAYNDSSATKVTSRRLATQYEQPSQYTSMYTSKPSNPWTESVRQADASYRQSTYRVPNEQYSYDDYYDDYYHYTKQPSGQAGYSTGKQQSVQWAKDTRGNEPYSYYYPLVTTQQRSRNNGTAAVPALKSQWTRLTAVKQEAPVSGSDSATEDDVDEYASSASESEGTSINEVYRHTQRMINELKRKNNAQQQRDQRRYAPGQFDDAVEIKEYASKAVQKPPVAQKNQQSQVYTIPAKHHVFPKLTSDCPSILAEQNSKEDLPNSAADQGDQKRPSGSSFPAKSGAGESSKTGRKYSLNAVSKAFDNTFRTILLQSIQDTQELQTHVGSYFKQITYAVVIGHHVKLQAVAEHDWAIHQAIIMQISTRIDEHIRQYIDLKNTCDDIIGDRYEAVLKAVHSDTLNEWMEAMNRVELVHTCLPVHEVIPDEVTDLYCQISKLYQDRVDSWKSRREAFSRVFVSTLECYKS